MDLFVYIMNIYNAIGIIMQELQIEALHILNKYGGI